MTKYLNYTVDDFLMDDQFHQWVFNSDSKNEAFWEEFIQRFPQKKEEVEEARQLLKEVRFREYTLTSEQNSRLWEGIRYNHHERKGIFASPYFKFGAAAAVLLLVLLLSIFKPDSGLESYSTGFGETREVILPDQSTVILNSNSSLTFSSGWKSAKMREVHLEGEAYFSVVHTEKHQPFRVTTNKGVSIEVLGTTFNVYEREEESKVVLNTGKIRLKLPNTAKSQEKEILMNPGELVVFHENSMSKRKVDPQVYVAWKDNKIILDHTSLAEMVRMAKDIYDLDIKVTSDSLLSQTVSGSMPKGDKESFVNHVGKAFQLKVGRKDDHYLIGE